MFTRYKPVHAASFPKNSWCVKHRGIHAYRKRLPGRVISFLLHRGSQRGLIAIGHRGHRVFLSRYLFCFTGMYGSADSYWISAGVSLCPVLNGDYRIRPGSIARNRKTSVFSVQSPCPTKSNSTKRNGVSLYLCAFLCNFPIICSKISP